MERDWQLEATAALSGSGVSKKLCSSYHSAIFYVGGEPHAFVALHLVDHFFEREGSAVRLPQRYPSRRNLKAVFDLP
ncbi:MAG TPA: hypothetical protein VFS81_14125 [Candidatus Binatia bacterium]|nr:hypothetical protein [Candidatus Binatia bacterium]